MSGGEVNRVLTGAWSSVCQPMPLVSMRKIPRAGVRWRLWSARIQGMNSRSPPPCPYYGQDLRTCYVGVVGLDLRRATPSCMGEEQLRSLCTAAALRPEYSAPQARPAMPPGPCRRYDREAPAPSGHGRDLVLQDMAPGRSLPAHVLDREQNLLAVPPHPVASTVSGIDSTRPSTCAT